MYSETITYIKVSELREILERKLNKLIVNIDFPETDNAKSLIKMRVMDK